MTEIDRHIKDRWGTAKLKQYGLARDESIPFCMVLQSIMYASVKQYGTITRQLVRKFKNTSFDWGFPSILGFFSPINLYIIVFLNRWHYGGFSRSSKWSEDSSQYLKHKVMDLSILTNTNWILFTSSNTIWFCDRTKEW